MPAQPPVREPEEEMEAEGESQLPEANGEVEEPRENEGGGGDETIEESMEERESDLEESEEEEEEEEESSGKIHILLNCWKGYKGSCVSRFCTVLV